MEFTPHTEKDRKEMLEFIGVEKVEDLFDSIPQELRHEISIPEKALSELEVYRRLRELASRNVIVPDNLNFKGGGVYYHRAPSAVNHLAGRSEFYTAYTPYQPEVSQGTLQAIYEYQTMIAELTGMDVSNASHYDGATALAEGVLMAAGATKREMVIVFDSLNPLYRMVLETYLSARGSRLTVLPTEKGLINKKKLAEALNSSVACVVFQVPSFFGTVDDVSSVSEMVHSNGSFVVTSNYALSLALLEAPGKYGADIATGDGQSLGLPPSFGGPYFGFMATKAAHARRLPGRIFGCTVDTQGRRGFVLTMQAREQHIRREKASSNICSNQALMALKGSIYLSLMGPEGLRKVAHLSVSKAAYAFEKLKRSGKVRLPFAGSPFFNEFVIETDVDATELQERLAGEGIGGGIPLGWFYRGPEYDAMKKRTLLAFTEMNDRAAIDLLVEKLEVVAR